MNRFSCFIGGWEVGVEELNAKCLFYTYNIAVQRILMTSQRSTQNPQDVNHMGKSLKLQLAKKCTLSLKAQDFFLLCRGTLCTDPAGWLQGSSCLSGASQYPSGWSPTARKTRRRAAHFSSKNSIEILSPSPMQFNLIDRTLHCVTFSIKNKWYGPDIWKPGICFCGQFDVPVANIPTCSAGKAKHGEAPLQITQLLLCIAGGFVPCLPPISSPFNSTRSSLVTRPTEKWECPAEQPSTVKDGW